MGPGPAHPVFWGGLISAFALGTLEVLGLLQLPSRRAADWQSAAEVWALVIGSALLVGLAIGAVLGPFAAAVERLARRTARAHRLRAAAYGSVLAAGAGVPAAWLLAGRWPEIGWPARAASGSAVVLYVAAVYGGIWLASKMLCRGKWRWPIAVCAGAVGLLFRAADNTLLLDLYPRFHDGLWISSMLFALAAVALVSPRRLPRNRLSAAWLGVLVLGGFLSGFAVHRLTARPTESRTVLSEAGLTRRVSGWLRAAFDRDGDGFGSVLGGDCDDSRADVNPTRMIDIPGNGVDEDCVGGDADSQSLVRKQAAGTWPQARRLNVLLITVDTLRAKNLGTYGYTVHPTSPHLDALAEESLVFERAYAPSNLTAGSLPSLLSGRYASRAPWNYPNEPPAKWSVLLETGAPTLARILGEAGYRTHATSHEGFFLRIYNAFRDIEDVEAGVDSVVPRFKHLLASDAPDPWHAWLHLYQPHAPYEENEELDWGDSRTARYDGEVRRSDAEIGEVLRALDRSGQRDRTMVILTSDHGEALGEHGHHGHSSSLYDEQILVPLIVRIPGIPPARVGSTVDLVDVLPTIMEGVGIDAPTILDGDSLLAHRTGHVAPKSCAYSEEYVYRVRKRMIVCGRYKLIQYREDNTYELFDLESDPDEAHNVAASAPGLVEKLRARLGTVSIRAESSLLWRAAHGEPEAVRLLRANYCGFSEKAFSVEARRLFGELPACSLRDRRPHPLWGERSKPDKPKKSTPDARRGPPLELRMPETEPPSAFCRPGRTGRCALDTINGEGIEDETRLGRTGRVSFAGWAAANHEHAISPVVVMELTSSDKAIYVRAARSMRSREDVALAFSEDALVWSGWEALTSFADVEPGTYGVRILQVDALGRTYVCDTRRKLKVE